jgi:hypothetical protein
MTSLRRFPDGLVPLPAGGLRSGRLATGLFVALVAGTALWCVVLPVAPRKLMGHEALVTERLRSQARPGDGSLVRLWEHDLRERSPARRALQPLWASTLYALWGHVPRELIVGRDGWLFLRNRVEFPGDPAEVLLRDATLRIAALRRRFAGAGIRLVALPVPPKAAVYPELLPEGTTTRTDLHPALVTQLRQLGVPVIDLLEHWRSHPQVQVYCRTDSHWSFEGALLAAEAITRAAGVWVPEEDRDLRIERVSSKDGVDLLRLAGLPVDEEHLQNVTAWLLRVGGRSLHPLSIAYVKTPLDGVFAARSSGGDAPVVVVGTSFSNWPCFPEYLHYFSQGRVLVEARPAEGALGGLRSWLSAFAAGERGSRLPEVLVWEFPTSTLLTNDLGLPGMEEILVQLPAPGLEPWNHGPSPVAFVQSGSLVPGRHAVGPSALQAWIPRHALDHPGDGTLGVRLRGTVTGPLLLTTFCGDYRVDVPWGVGRSEVVLPLLDSGHSQELRITLRATDEPAALDLESVELVTDLTTPPGAGASPTPPRADAGGWNQEARFPSSTGEPGDLVWVRLALPRGTAITAVLLEVESEGGTRLIEVAAGGIGPNGQFLLPVGHGRAQRVVVRGTGAPPPRALAEVRLLAPGWPKGGR